MNKLKLIAFTSIILLTGCIGKQASVSENFQDNFAFTSAKNISDLESKCIMLTKPFTLTSGSVTYAIPAGKYIARKKNDTGYFYYAPTPITSSNWFLASPQQGIYLDNNLNKGNLFGVNPAGYDDRPIRNLVLPSAIFSLINRTCHLSGR